jgi:micrococcal nuclease
MRSLKHFQAIWLLLLFLPFACSPESGPQQKVVGVMDGDTIEILENNRPTKVRLYGIDAPEKAQDYGSRARQFVSDLVFGKNVRLIEKGKDRYGRVIGIVLLPDGRSLNEEVVRNGYAWYYRDYAKDPVLERLEEDARQSGRGLWEMANPTAPWEFRKNRRSASANASPAKPKPAKQPAPRYGPAKAAALVFICDSKGATSYHTSRTCTSLKRCKSDIKRVALQTALDAGRRPDKVCVGSSPN